MRSRGHTWLLFVVVVALAQAARAQSPEEQARKFVDSTWSEADAVAKMLVLRDFLEAFNELAATLSAVGAANKKSLQLPDLRAELIAAMMRSASTGLAEVERGEQDLTKVLQNYRDLVALRYRLSWYSLNSLVESRALMEAAPLVASIMKAKCDRGSSLEGDDFFTTPRPALPRLDLRFSGKVTLWGDPEPGSPRDSFTISTDNGSQERSAWIVGGSALGTGACLAYPPTLPIASVCGAATGLIISGLFSLVDLDSENEKLAEMARAEALRYNGRAVAKDVNNLYRKRCGYAVNALDQVAQALRLTPAERSAFVRRVDAKEFEALQAQYADGTDRESRSRCRISAADLNQRKQCPPEGTATLHTTFTTDPACARLLRPAEQCPQVVSNADNGCRKAPDGTLSIYMVPESGSSVLESPPVCRVEPPYDVTADKVMLVDLSAKRSDPVEQAKFAADTVALLTAGMLKALASTDDLRQAFSSGEDELDRQQQYALTKMVRLIQFVRTRKQLLALQQKVAQPPTGSATLRASVSDLVASSGKALSLTVGAMPGAKFAQAADQAMRRLSEADLRNRDARVTELRILSRQLVQTYF